MFVVRRFVGVYLVGFLVDAPERSVDGDLVSTIGIITTQSAVRLGPDFGSLAVLDNLEVDALGMVDVFQHLGQSRITLRPNEPPIQPATEQAQDEGGGQGTKDAIGHNTTSYWADERALGCGLKSFGRLL